nr:SRPBCC domain-containing protein [Chryseobacterium sp. 3008163]
MNSEIVFNKDFDSKSIYVMKVYDAEVSKVWDYFTHAELLDQWWAPKPWKCETENLNFEEGGVVLLHEWSGRGENLFTSEVR